MNHEDMKPANSQPVSDHVSDRHTRTRLMNDKDRSRRLDPFMRQVPFHRDKVVHGITRGNGRGEPHQPVVVTIRRCLPGDFKFGRLPNELAHALLGISPVGRAVFGSKVECIAGITLANHSQTVGDIVGRNWHHRKRRDAQYNQQNETNQCGHTVVLVPSDSA